jgi:DNA invertase Pin-like site-specific DNA recombinase
MMKTRKTEQTASGRRYGYGRVSTRDQHTDAQHDALLAAGVDARRIYVEKASTRLAQRPELERLRKILEPGDTLVITKVITLEVLSGTFNRDDPMGEAFFQMTGVFAQLERDLIRVRTHEGLEAARARGRTGGRKAKLTGTQAAEVRRLYAAREKTVAEIGELFGITRESVYRYVRGAQDDQQSPAKPATRTVQDRASSGTLASDDDMAALRDRLSRT